MSRSRSTLRRVSPALVAGLVVVLSCRGASPGTSPQVAVDAAPPVPTPTATAPPATPTPPAAAGGFDQAAAVASLRALIAGKEQQPAETVFKNIQILRGVPAGRVLPIMEMGFSPALGVDCTHCHVPGRWESDEKKEKQIAREMSKMTREINEKYLAAIQGLDSEKPAINCTTCHRGQVKPALRLAAR